MFRLSVTGCALWYALSVVPPASAQTQIPEITINALPSDLATPPIKQRYQLPQTTASTTTERIDTTVNAVDASDALKYFPSLLMRKRNYGDNQAVLASRIWGLNSSARTLIYVDDILISNLQGNNNSNASPRWGMVSPEEISRMDFLYGPYGAMYPGNSIGGVLQITTKMPDKPVVNIKQSESFQTFDLYNTKGTYRTDQTSLSLGNRWNDLAVFVSGSYLNSYSQPLAWITTAGTPVGTTGAISALSRTGSVANVIGAGGLLHTEQANFKTKAALDITSWLQATYTLGFWSNDQRSSVQTYLRDAAGNPTFGGSGTVGGSSFAGSNYTLNQQNLANAFSVKTDTGGAFDWDIVVTRYDYLKDIQRNPFTVAATGAAFTDMGRITRLDGTNWTTADARGIWRIVSPVGPHEVSFGTHGDLYVLNNPIYQTSTWYGGPDSTSSLYNRSNGKTQTIGLWAQDAWRFAPRFKLTVGGRWETWRAHDGNNLTTTTNSTTGAITGTTTINQPGLNATAFSPKASLTWEPNKDWQVTGAFGVANRFPTVTELYQIATLSGVLINPNPNLKPERALSGELAVERIFSDGKVRLSLFREDTSDMLVSQNSTIPGTTTTTSFVTNVDKVRNRGIEFAWQKNNLPIEKLELFGSVTYVDSVILSNPSFVGAGGSTSEGKRVPYVPAWRTTLGGTYRFNEALSWTVAGRYQSKVYATLDNTDYVSNVYQAFDSFLVVDIRLLWKVNERGSISFGVDNLTNKKYTLFHPFQQRTFVVQGRVQF